MNTSYDYFVLALLILRHSHGGIWSASGKAQSPALASRAFSSETPKRYNVTSTDNKYFGEIYFAGDWRPIERMAAWCGQCHTRYDAYRQGRDPPRGHTDSGDPIFRYRHTVRYDSDIECGVCHTISEYIAANPLGIDPYAIAHEPACQNCHVAHGTSAQIASYAGSVPWPAGWTEPSGSGRSSLLRLVSGGVCVGCHAK